MRTASESPANVFAQHTDIRSLAARHLQREKRRETVQQNQFMNRHRPCFPFQLEPRPGVLVQRLAVAFQRGIHGRNLQYVSPETGKNRFDSVPCQTMHLAGHDNVAFRVAGRRLHTQMDDRFIRLVSVQQIL